MKRLLVLVLLVSISVTAAAQFSIIGGFNINFRDFDPKRKLFYFGGTEVKFPLAEKYKLYLSAVYTGLNENDTRLNSVLVPVGISYQFNEMWDEETALFRVVDVNFGGYGGYVFKVSHNNEDVTDAYKSVDYGLQISVKMRLFVFYPLYMSYIYGLADIDKSDAEYKQYMLQLGAYFPLSTILHNY